MSASFEDVQLHAEKIATILASAPDVLEYLLQDNRIETSYSGEKAVIDTKKFGLYLQEISKMVTRLPTDTKRALTYSENIHIDQTLYRMPKCLIDLLSDPKCGIGNLCVAGNVRVINKETKTKVKREIVCVDVEAIDKTSLTDFLLVNEAQAVTRTGMHSIFALLKTYSEPDIVTELCVKHLREPMTRLLFEDLTASGMKESQAKKMAETMYTSGKTSGKNVSDSKIETYLHVPMDFSRFASILKLILKEKISSDVPDKKLETFLKTNPRSAGVYEKFRDAIGKDGYAVYLSAILKTASGCR